MNLSSFHPWYLLSAILAASASFEIRPHSVSWILLSLTLMILQDFYDGKTKHIRWLPLIMLLWVNLHSLFILGLAVTAIYGLVIFLKKKELIKPLIKPALLSLLVCFLNPYGWHCFTLNFEQFFTLQSGNIFKSGIRELQSPFSISNYSVETMFSSWHFFDLFLLFSAFLLWIQRKKIKIHEWLILLIFFYFSATAAKNIGYLVFAVTPILASKDILGFTRKKKTKRREGKAMLSRLPEWGFIIISIFLILSIITNAFYIQFRNSYRFGLGWSNANLPVKAVEFMNRNNIHGRILNQLDFGGYLEFFTNEKVSIDGRLDVMGTDNFNEQVNAVTDQQKTALLNKLSPEIILFAYFSTPDWISYLQKQPDWKLIYADETTALYVTISSFPEIEAYGPKDLTNDMALYSETEIMKMVQNGISHVPLSGLFQRQYYPEREFNMTAFCFYYGWTDAAKTIMANAFARSTQDYPELYQNLGSVYFELRNAPAALFCYERYLKKRPNPQVEKRVNFLRTKL